MREALNYLFDYEWTRANLSFGLFQRTKSFFANSELAATGLPSEWVGRMKRALAALTGRFSADRMLREYAEGIYLPASGREGWGSDLDEVRLWSA